MSVTNLSSVINQQPPGRLQILVLCSIVTLLDGFDAQSIGYVAPALTKARATSRPSTGSPGSSPCRAKREISGCRASLPRIGRASALPQPTGRCAHYAQRLSKDVAYGRCLLRHFRRRLEDICPDWQRRHYLFRVGPPDAYNYTLIGEQILFICSGSATLSECLAKPH
jgi:hypothetical protein